MCSLCAIKRAYKPFGHAISSAINLAATHRQVYLGKKMRFFTIRPYEYRRDRFVQRTSGSTGLAILIFPRVRARELFDQLYGEGFRNGRNRVSRGNFLQQTADRSLDPSLRIGCTSGSAHNVIRGMVGHVVERNASAERATVHRRGRHLSPPDKCPISRI